MKNLLLIVSLFLQGKVLVADEITPTPVITHAYKNSEGAIVFIASDKQKNRYFWLPKNKRTLEEVQFYRPFVNFTERAQGQIILPSGEKKLFSFDLLPPTDLKIYLDRIEKNTLKILPLSPKIIPLHLFKDKYSDFYLLVYKPLFSNARMNTEALMGMKNFLQKTNIILNSYDQNQVISFEGDLNLFTRPSLGPVLFHIRDHKEKKLIKLAITRKTLLAIGVPQELLLKEDSLHLCQRALISKK